MYYISPLTTSKTTDSPKIEGLRRLIDLHIPTIRLPFIINNALYQDYLQSSNVSPQALKELGHVFATFESANQPVTLRNSIYEPNHPELSYVVDNILNISSFAVLKKHLQLGFDIAISRAAYPNALNFYYLIQAFYQSRICGSLTNLSEGINITAVAAEHTKVLTREDIHPDCYSMDSSGKLLSTTLGVHDQFLKITRRGVRPIVNRFHKSRQPLLNPDHLKKLANWSKVIASKHGPHQLMWAVLTDNTLIVQDLQIIYNKEEEK